MGVINSIRNILGITAAEQRAAAEAEERRKIREQEAEERRQERAAAAEDRKAMMDGMQAMMVTIAALKQPAQPSPDALAAEKGALEDEVNRLKTELAQMRQREIQAADSAAEAIRSYLKGVGARMDEHNRARGVGRPSKDGRKIQIRFDEELVNRLDWLKECIPGFVITEFTNTAVKDSLQSFLDANPAILVAMDEYFQRIVDKELALNNNNNAVENDEITE